MIAKIKAYLQLCRLPNLPTAAADIFAGMSLAGLFNGHPTTIYKPLCLVFASVFLYAGGVVLNDVFDLELDKVERPERPIPNGTISLKEASLFGAILLSIGILLAFSTNLYSGLIAFTLALFILLYDAIAKKNDVFGPMAMGICRGLNLLLGISIFGVFTHLEYMVIPVIFIGAITLVSRGEVHGGNKRNILFSGLLYGVVLVLLLYFHNLNQRLWYQYLPFLMIFGTMTLLPLVKAYRTNTPKNIKLAVISGVLGMIALDATIVSAYSNWTTGILLLLLLPLSIFLSKVFAVT